MVGKIARVFTSLTTATFARGARDDDAVDRLNHVVIHGLLIFLAVFTGTKQYAGSPIYCWLPAEYTEKFQRKFANHYCWVNTIYHVPFDEEVPFVEDKRYFNDVSYYRWSTMMFVLLAALFRIPQLLWTELKHFSGANIQKLVGMTADTTMMDQEKRDKQLGYVAEYVHRWVTTRSVPDRTGRFAFLQKTAANYIICYGKRSGHNLVVSYLFIKFLYLLNAICQFFIVSYFLKTNYWNFGMRAVSSYVRDGQWEDDNVFPRVALCDMKVPVLENIHIYTIQCVLGINLFLEKFFFILWFCLIFILVANAVSFIRWTIQIVLREKTITFLSRYSRHLFPKHGVSHEEKKLFLDMGRSYLKADGVFLLRIIAENSTDLLTADLIRQIWLRYKTFKEEDDQETEEDFQKASPIETKMNGVAELQIDDVDK